MDHGQEYLPPVEKPQASVVTFLKGVFLSFYFSFPDSDGAVIPSPVRWHVVCIK